MTGKALLEIQRIFRENAFRGDEAGLRAWITDQSVLHKKFEWESLLRARRILLISESGIGKTFECERQAESLFKVGKPAFFLRLETVALTGVASALHGKKKQRFDAWYAAGSGMGYFFLDSIDELELVHGDFRAALNRLADDLNGVLGRATIVVTSRPVAIDRAAFHEILPSPRTLRGNLTVETWFALPFTVQKRARVMRIFAKWNSYR